MTKIIVTLPEGQTAAAAMTELTARAKQSRFSMQPTRGEPDPLDIILKDMVSPYHLERVKPVTAPKGGDEALAARQLVVDLECAAQRSKPEILIGRLSGNGWSAECV